MRRVIAVVGLKMDNQLRVNDQLAGNSDHFFLQLATRDLIMTYE